MNSAVKKSEVETMDYEDAMKDIKKTINEGNSEYAIKQLAELLNYYQTSEIYFLLAREYQKLKNYLQALLFYKKAEETLTKADLPTLKVKLYYYLGEFLYIQKDIKKSKIYLEKAISLSKNLIDAYKLLCEIAFAEKDFKSLEKYAQIWLKYESDSFKANEYLGYAVYSQKNYKAAEEFFEKSFELYPHNDTYKEYLKGLTYDKKKAELGDIKKRIKENELALKKEPNMDILLETGFLYLFNEEYSKSEKIFVKVREYYLKAMK